jgi:hypothetical protein
MAMFGQFTGEYVRIDVELESLEKFYRMVNWLNNNAGHGRHNWTSYGRIKRHLVKNGTCTAKIVVTSPEVTHQQVFDFFEQL